MKAKILKLFIDKKNNVINPVGKIIELSEERFDEIISLKGDPLIEQVEEDGKKPDNSVKDERSSKSEQNEEVSEFPKHTGGGYYELSNGKKIKGKDAAIAAQADIV